MGGLNAGPHRALLVPEILGEVLQHLLGDNAALYSAVRVSRLWFAVGVDYLWRRPHDKLTKALLSIDAPARRQFYADKVQAVTFANGMPYAESMVLPNLRELFISEKFRLPYNARRILQPSLRALTAPCTSAIVDGLIQQHGLVNLRKLCLDIKGHLTAFRRLVDWLKVHPLPYLAWLYLFCFNSPEAGVFNQLFRIVARFPGLKKLQLHGGDPKQIISAATVNDIASSCSQLSGGRADSGFFCQLDELAMFSDWAAVQTLVPMLPAVTSLQLAVCGGGASAVLSAVAHLRQLRSLSLYFEETSHVSRSSLLALQHLRQLRSLIIHRAGSASEVTESDLAQLLSGLEDLIVLCLNIVIPAAPRKLGLICKACRQLQSLALSSEELFDFSVSNAADAGFFPALEILKIRWLAAPFPPNYAPDRDEMERQAAHQAQLLYRLVPKLDSLSVRSDNAVYDGYLQRALIMERDARA